MQFAPSTRSGHWVIGTAGDCENIFWKPIESPTRIPSHSFLSWRWSLVKKCWTMLDTCVMHPYASLLICVNEQVYMWNCLSCFVVLFTPPCCTISGKVWRQHSSEILGQDAKPSNRFKEHHQVRAGLCAVWNAEVWNILHHFHPKEQAGGARCTYS